MNAMERCMSALNRLCKWRTVFVGWRLGSRLEGDPGVKAERDAVDARLTQRAELSALVNLLIARGEIGQDEYFEAVAREADFLSEALESQFPGFKVDDDGVHMDPTLGLQTMREKGFPP